MPACRPNLRVVDLAQRVVEVAELRQDDDRAEGLLAVERLVARHVFEQRRFEHRALALAAAEQLARRRPRASWIQPSRRLASLSAIIGPMKVSSCLRIAHRSAP